MIEYNDNTFGSTDFESKYPLAHLNVASREGSDHTPLILDLGIMQNRKPYLFRFEKWWLEQPDFKKIGILLALLEALKMIWSFSSQGVSSVQSLYANISFRGVTPVYSPAVWSLCPSKSAHVLVASF